MSKPDKLCPVCHGPMKAKSSVDGSILGEILGLIVFVAGVLVCLTVVGIPIGLLLMALGYLVSRRKKHKHWLCIEPVCRHVEARA